VPHYLSGVTEWGWQRQAPNVQINCIRSYHETIWMLLSVLAGNEVTPMITVGMLAVSSIHFMHCCFLIKLHIVCSSGTPSSSPGPGPTFATDKSFEYIASYLNLQYSLSASLSERDKNSETEA